MSIHVLNIIKSIEKDIAAMTINSLPSITKRINEFGETICSSNAEILRKQFWAQAKFMEYV